MNLLPCIVFAFSRAGLVKYAEELDPQDMALALARALVWAKGQLMVQSDWAGHPPFD